MTIASEQPTSMSEQDQAQYWERYYAERKSTKVPVPSQFAAFLAQEIPDNATVVDVGCGNGRDSIFFAAQAHPVLGLDGSHAAIDACRTVASAAGVDHARFETVGVTDASFGSVLRRLVAEARGPVVVYARFFLHAITDDAQAEMISAVAAALRPDDLFAVEYRTTKDAALIKETAEHYRRYIDPAQLIVEVCRQGFAVDYAVEGFGYAKYRHDDAHIARAIFRSE
ncbi:class I SAM-dependent methyltransferase [Aeromicrobium wangtongii]|uniref:class I SAM-dependent methyltransferase n=1 Tax=Aeromicrobium wangtongii TaxID=2969247 RepID=UPI002016CFFA|nr:class I SAM-dependent methyltransferase [Aeromicrobium wangtongii]MCL3816995.1 class I SAM-dependent methyltransferase [Aeromicrobium wangtongii]